MPFLWGRLHLLAPRDPGGYWGLRVPALVPECPGQAGGRLSGPPWLCMWAGAGLPGSLPVSAAPGSTASSVPCRQSWGSGEHSAESVGRQTLKHPVRCAAASLLHVYMGPGPPLGGKLSITLSRLCSRSLEGLDRVALGFWPVLPKFLPSAHVKSQQLFLQAQGIGPGSTCQAAGLLPVFMLLGAGRWDSPVDLPSWLRKMESAMTRLVKETRARDNCW